MWSRPGRSGSCSAEGAALGASVELVDGQAVVTLAANKLPASPTPYTVTIKYSGDEFVKAGYGHRHAEGQEPIGGAQPGAGPQRGPAFGDAH